MPRPIHARDIRYSRDVTLCLRKATPSAVDDPADATCPFCLTVQQQRERMDAEVKSGKFWDRFR
jgi:hypothetical protein